MLQAVQQPGVSDNPAKFEETWKSWEHQVDVCENLSSSKLDDDVKIRVVLREAPTETARPSAGELSTVLRATTTPTNTESDLPGLPEREQDMDRERLTSEKQIQWMWIT